VKSSPSSPKTSTPPSSPNNNIDKLFLEMDDISILYTFSSLDYILKDVRVIYLRDFELSIRPLVVISAREGDMTSIPRWISIILSKYDVVEIHDEDQLSYIKRALNRERISQSHMLSTIEPDFYAKVNNYLHNIEDKDRESLIVALNPFIASRLQKIVKLSASSPLVPELEEKLSVEEKFLYENFYYMTSKFKKLVLKLE
jgi:DNA replication factor GINS